MPNINSTKIPNATQDIAFKDTFVLLNWLSLWRFDFVASAAKVNGLLPIVPLENARVVGAGAAVVDLN